MTAARASDLPARRRFRDRTPAQWFCLIVGVLLALRGAQQFINGASFATPGEGWRASQQLVTGVLLLAAQRSPVFSFRVLIPFAAYYTVLAFVGDINGHEAFGLLPVDTRDEYVHPFYAASALLILGLDVRRHRNAERMAAGAPAAG
jgi:hypothetical protein